MSVGWAIAFALAGAFGISAISAPLLGLLARKIGMVDVPRAHKAHARITPLLGGSAIFLGVAIPVLVAGALVAGWQGGGAPGWLSPGLAVHLDGAAGKLPTALGILAVAAGLHAMGLVDDARALGPWVKLGVQVVAALVTAWALEVRVLTFAGPAISIAVSTVWLVVILNAMNFLDNMDGLSAGVAAIIAAALLLAAMQMGQVFVAAWLAVLLGALLGFLPQNVPPARMFMGDAGSLVIGYLLGVLSCLTTYAGSGASHFLYGVFVPPILLAVPLYDTASVMLLRIRAGQNPMVGDRRHFSHRLRRRGMSTRKAVGTIYLCTLATAMGAMLLPHVASPLGAVLVFAQTLAILGVIALLESGGPGSD